MLRDITLQYLKEIRDQRAILHSTEELSYRHALDTFLRAASTALGKTADFTGEPRRITLGRPDFAVTNGLKVIGYVEAEALGTDLRNLAGHAKEQNDRFRDNLHNFLQTNHFDFRLFVDGKLAANAQLPDPQEQGRITVSAAELDALQRVLETFLDGATPPAATPAALALQLARRARFLRAATDSMLSGSDTPLHPLWNLYKQNLFTDISAEKFADVYAQTFVYGLFLAWLNTDKAPFDRSTALSAIPDAVPPIQVLLEFGDGRRLPEEFKWIIDGTCADLQSADKAGATRHGAGIEDPLVSFYETFLKAYDPELRDRAGVFYTPDPAVDFIVRAVDYVLRRYFDKEEGLADNTVRVLDPATGTATFLARSYKQVKQNITDRGDGDLWPDRARNHVMQHFYGFERLPAAYTLAHVKLRQLLAETGVALSETDRLPVYLADTMANKVPEQLNLPGAAILSAESREAAHIRDSENILVVMGNPPYFGKSDNPSKDSMGAPTFIGELIQTYYSVDGVPLGEKNPKWLQNDYVKFIRFAQWRIDRTGHGVVAFITDNSYLDNPTYRGMRRSLMKSFDDIYILDLHGNSNKQERSPDGSEDKNVFDIQQGVAIAIFVKSEAKVDPSPETTLQFAEYFGSRQSKYDALRGSSMESIKWIDIAPNAPHYLFMPQSQTSRNEYENADRSWPVNEVFPVNGWGIATRKDYLLIAFDRQELIRRFEDIRRLSASQAADTYDIVQGIDWVRNAQANLTGDISADARPILYRPFDTRYVLYRKALIERGDHRYAIMRHLLQPNLSLITTRITKEPFSALAYKGLSEHKASVRYDGTFVFPLWLYPQEGTLEEGEDMRANIAPAFTAALAANIGTPPEPEDIFSYAYAVLHAPTYRSRYAAFLKTDFPRLPLPPDADTFHALAALGAKLTALHLLEAQELTSHGIGYKGGGSHEVKKMREADRYGYPVPGGATGRVRLNDVEYFDNVPPEAWTYQVGGYRPAAKWLDDRVGRRLTEDDITHYRRMLAAMRDTVALLPAVDAAFQRILDADETASAD